MIYLSQCSLSQKHKTNALIKFNPIKKKSMSRKRYCKWFFDSKIHPCSASPHQPCDSFGVSVLSSSDTFTQAKMDQAPDLCSQQHYPCGFFWFIAMRRLFQQPLLWSCGFASVSPCEGQKYDQSAAEEADKFQTLMVPAKQILQTTDAPQWGFV